MLLGQVSSSIRAPPLLGERKRLSQSFCYRLPHLCIYGLGCRFKYRLVLVALQFRALLRVLSRAFLALARYTSDICLWCLNLLLSQLSGWGLLYRAGCTQELLF